MAAGGTLPSLCSIERSLSAEIKVPGSSLKENCLQNATVEYILVIEGHLVTNYRVVPLVFFQVILVNDVGASGSIPKRRPEGRIDAWY